MPEVRMNGAAPNKVGESRLIEEDAKGFRASCILYVDKSVKDGFGGLLEDIAR